MPTRRLLLATLLAGGLALPGRARADNATAAKNFINNFLTQTLAVVNGSGADKAAALQKLIDGAVDVAGVARFCLGRFWRQANPQQQAEYVTLFRKVLMNNVTARIGEYSGVSFVLGDSQVRDDGIAVGTTVTRPHNAPNKVEWIVAMIGGQPRIIDVIAEGTSLRLTQRSDYTSFLGQHNGDVGMLIAALRKQTS